MNDNPYNSREITNASQVGPLWLLMMSLNLLFTAIGTAVRDGSCGDTEERVSDTSNEVTYGVCIALYVLLSPCCLVLNHIDKIYQNDKTLSLQDRFKEVLRMIKWWRVLRDIMVFIAGGLYLAGDNLALIRQLGDPLNENTHITYEDLRGYFLGISLLLGLVYTFFTQFAGEMVKKGGPEQTVLIGILDMTSHRLFPMLMFTVQVDQIYTAIVGEVVHHTEEVTDGTKCPISYVNGGITFFVAVGVIWFAVVCVVIGIPLCQLHNFKKDNYNKGTGSYIAILVIFGIILVLYTPAYIALDNRWPWICIAKCQLEKEECVVNITDMCGYVKARTVLLFLLWAFTTFSLIPVYIISSVATAYGADLNSDVERISSQHDVNAPLVRSTPGNHEDEIQC